MKIPTVAICAAGAQMSTSVSGLSSSFVGITDCVVATGADARIFDRAGCKWRDRPSHSRLAAQAPTQRAIICQVPRVCGPVHHMGHAPGRLRSRSRFAHSGGCIGRARLFPRKVICYEPVMMGRLSEASVPSQADRPIGRPAAPGSSVDAVRIASRTRYPDFM